METSSKLFKKDWVEMKPIKIPFMKGCGYRSERYCISVYIDGIIDVYDFYTYSHGDVGIDYLKDSYFLSSLQNNNVSKVDFTNQHIFYNKIFDRLKNDT